MNENFTNLRTKADILDRMGRQSEAKSTRDKSMKLATEGELNNLGYSYLNAGKIKDALDMFERNVKAHPDSWNVYDSLAEGLEKGGDKAGAIKNYERALKMVNDEANKKRISDTISKLKSQ
jgi:Tfp pilus assembly protein PilF